MKLKIRVTSEHMAQYRHWAKAYGEEKAFQMIKALIEKEETRAPR